jgi:hypothetical protein
MPQMILISEDIEMACHKAATLKFIRAHGTLGRTPRYNAKLNIHERISEYAESLASEFVVARELGIDYDLNYDGFKQFADVGSNIEVRWTRWNVGHLIVYPTDRDDDIAILVCGKSPTYRIAGWIPIKVARTNRYKHSSQDSWWVDQHNLQPMENLYKSSHGIVKA